MDSTAAAKVETGDTSLDAELDAQRKVYEAIERLDPTVAERVCNWASRRRVDMLKSGVIEKLLDRMLEPKAPAPPTPPSYARNGFAAKPPT